MLQAHCGSLLLDPAVLAQVRALAHANNILKHPEVSVICYCSGNSCIPSVGLYYAYLLSVTKCTSINGFIAAWQDAELPLFSWL